MTAPRHHLPDALLMGYAAGALPAAFDLLVATHLSLCDVCRAAAGAYDAVGGALIEGATPAVLDVEAFERLMARLEGAPATVPPPIATPDPVLPGPLRDHIGGGLDAVRWRPVGGGVRQSVLVPGTPSLRLLHIPAGARVPDHGHRGTELTLVLQGAFRDDRDLFARGDVEVANEALHHMPVAEPGADCLCLAASDGPMVFSGLLPRLAQRFLNI